VREAIGRALMTLGLPFGDNKNLGGMGAQSQPRNNRWLSLFDGEPLRYGAADDAPDAGYGRYAREPAAGRLADVARHVR
jgi:hypothetical protein